MFENPATPFRLQDVVQFSDHSTKYKVTFLLSDASDVPSRTKKEHKLEWNALFVSRVGF